MKNSDFIIIRQHKAIIGIFLILLSWSARTQPLTELNNNSIKGGSENSIEVSAEAEVRSITVKTAGDYSLTTHPRFCLLSNCHVPSAGLKIQYTQAPDLANKLRESLLNKYFLLSDPVDPETYNKFSHEITVRTMFFGSADDYKKYLARVSSEVEAKEAQEKAAVLTGIAMYLVTRGSVQAQENDTTRQRILSNREVANLPGGVKGVLVTRVELLNRYNGKEQFSGHEEVLTATYDDVTEKEIRRINVEQGIKRVFGLFN